MNDLRETRLTFPLAYLRKLQFAALHAYKKIPRTPVKLKINLLIYVFVTCWYYSMRIVADMTIQSHISIEKCHKMVVVYRFRWSLIFIILMAHIFWGWYMAITLINAPNWSNKHQIKVSTNAVN
jgi:hypothetical protein